MGTKRVYILSESCGTIIVFFSNAKKAFDFLNNKERHVWVNNCSYTYFQRTISQTNKKEWFVINYRHERYFYKIEVCFEKSI